MNPIFGMELFRITRKLVSSSEENSLEGFMMLQKHGPKEK